MELNQIAVPGVYLLIFFLGYPSQLLFYYLEPAPLTKSELWISNVVLVLIFLTYSRAVFVDPGRVPKSYGREEEKGNSEGVTAKGEGQKRTKWCRKCNAVKPPRAHHCKECKRCIPKMDHHCPWTANCVSHTTFPHFLRFLLYTTAGLSYLAHLLYIRLAHLWANRNMPAYLGPSPWLVAHLFATTVINSITLFALGVLLIRNLWCLAVNTTTIEGWEIERHRTLLRRARHFGGVLTAADGSKVVIERQEFPYDIGIWANIVQGMGTANPLLWFLPLSPTPPLKTGLTFPTNDFNAPSMTWPPPDPDRTAYRRPAYHASTGTGPSPGNGVTAESGNDSAAFNYADSNLNAQDAVAAFRARQHADAVRRRLPFAKRLEAELKSRSDTTSKDSTRAQDRDYDYYDDENLSDASSDAEVNVGEAKADTGSQSGEEGWRNREGERLGDFGVDEEVEFYDEETAAADGLGDEYGDVYEDVSEDNDEDEDVPLGELLARRRAGRVQV